MCPLTSLMKVWCSGREMAVKVEMSEAFTEISDIKPDMDRKELTAQETYGSDVKSFINGTMVIMN